MIGCTMTHFSGLIDFVGRLGSFLFFHVGAGGSYRGFLVVPE